MLLKEISSLNYPALVFFGEADELGPDSFDEIVLVHSAHEMLDFMKKEMIDRLFDHGFFQRLSDQTIDMDEFDNEDVTSKEELRATMVPLIIEVFHEINDDLEDGDNFTLWTKPLSQLK